MTEPGLPPSAASSSLLCPLSRSSTSSYAACAQYVDSTLRPTHIQAASWRMHAHGGSMLPKAGCQVCKHTGEHDCETALLAFQGGCMLTCSSMSCTSFRSMEDSSRRTSKRMCSASVRACRSRANTKAVSVLITSGSHSFAKLDPQHTHNQRLSAAAAWNADDQLQAQHGRDVPLSSCQSASA